MQKMLTVCTNSEGSTKTEVLEERMNGLSIAI